MKKLCLKNLDSKKCFVFCLAVLCIFLIIIVGSFIVSPSFSALIDDDVEVTEKSLLTYYLNVSYDGIDKYGIESNNTTISDVRSGTIYVQDRIPDGLIFDGFVTTDDGSIGAVRRGTDKFCTGKVNDDTNEESVVSGVWNENHTEYTYHGLHYNENTRTVSFEVKNLQAGCELTVGIKTTTPTVDDPKTEIKELRRDFYNFSTAHEKDLTIKSNTVHVFIGSDSEKLFKVKYKFTGDIPPNAPIPPLDMEYASGTEVGVSLSLDVEGYEFSGWKTNDVNVNNGTFTMPEKDVVFEGYYTRASENKVTYALVNDIAPDKYVLPGEKKYYVGSTVNVDSLKEGDVIDGYRFLGWKTNDIIINDGEFTMPRKDVFIIGEFEEVTYKVIYKFHDTVLPPDSNSLLPDTNEYKVGAEVTLENVKNEPSGYKFLGWYKEEKFAMPNKDVVIYGEWKEQKGLFSPTISKEITNKQDSYQNGDVVNYKIIITNTADFSIKDIVVKENNEKAYFISSSNYELIAHKIIKINELLPNEFIELYASYEVTYEDVGTIDNEVQILSASADNGFELDTSKEYKAMASFKIKSRIKICKTVDKTVNSDDKFQFNIKGASYESSVELENNECSFTYIEPGSYSVEEKLSQYYLLKEVSGAINSNGGTLKVEFNKSYEINFENRVKVINPNTGDSVLRFLPILLMLLILSIVVIIYKGRKKLN